LALAPAPRLVLASASPRRLELLRQIGIAPAAVDPAEVDEGVRPRELPRDHALRLAREKAAAVAPRHPGALILAADTVVACGRRILPKAESEADLRACLPAVAMIGPDGTRRERLGLGIVAFKRLEAAEIDAYVRCGEGLGKAGGYAIQGRAAAFVRFLEGSYGAVVGLPLFETAQLLRSFGLQVPS